jgi:hypothetical protein
MYRVDQMLGNPNHTQLAEIYSSFTEGFETADLKLAKGLLDSVPLDGLITNSAQPTSAK